MMVAHAPVNAYLCRNAACTSASCTSATPWPRSKLLRSRRPGTSSSSGIWQAASAEPCSGVRPKRELAAKYSWRMQRNLMRQVINTACARCCGRCLHAARLGIAKMGGPRLRHPGARVRLEKCQLAKRHGSRRQDEIRTSSSNDSCVRGQRKARSLQDQGCNGLRKRERQSAPRVSKLPALPSKPALAPSCTSGSTAWWSGLHQHEHRLERRQSPPHSKRQRIGHGITFLQSKP